jgi:hypothetical protein
MPVRIHIAIAPSRRICAPVQRRPDMPETIYDALRESHEIQRSPCRKLLRAKPGTQDRISLFKALHTELAAHAAAEERFLYAPAQANGSRRTMLASRSGPVLTIASGQPASSSSARR